MRRIKCPHCGEENCWHLKCSHNFLCGHNKESLYCCNCNMGKKQWEKYLKDLEEIKNIEL